jgi:hypothetical protein
MKSARGFSLVLFALFQLQAFAQNPRVIVASTASKELKRSAHRLRIPVDQLKNARQALKEATDLVPMIAPYPTEQISSLVQNWQNLDHIKAKDIIDSFIQGLRSQAAQAQDYSSYQRLTSAAMNLFQTTSEPDYETMLAEIRSWPDPPASFGDAALKYRQNLESQARSSILWRLIDSNPEKAYEVLSQSADDGSYNYSTLAQIAQRLMNKGKKEDALRIIDQTMNNFSRQANDPRAIQEYGNFIPMAASLDSSRAETALNQWIVQMKNQPPADNCAGKLQSGDTTVDLTCNESKILSTVRSFYSKPGLTMKTLNSMPGLEAKLDSIGGIDALFGSSSGSQPVNITTYDPRNSRSRTGVSIGSATVISSSNSPGNLIQELQGKSETNPGLVKQKLRSLAKGPEDIDKLINLANSASYQDPALAELALEIAEPLLPRIEPVQKRAQILQTMIRAYRQADGEVDTELLKSGYVIADQLRQEQSARQQPKAGEFSGYVNLMPGYATEADRLEAFLTAELSRDNFESAIRYVHSLEPGSLKLLSLIQIVQALSSQNY